MYTEDYQTFCIQKTYHMTQASGLLEEETAPLYSQQNH